MAGVRLAVRAMILRDSRLLLVNAYPGGTSDLWCAPGGGVLPHASLHENLIREAWEETGLRIAVDCLALVNEFHDPGAGFHQVEMIFRCHPLNDMPAEWHDPEGIVTERRWVTEGEARRLRVKPGSLIDTAFGCGTQGASYDPLEPIVR
jgi:8-oxo-dGTP diphosphatase